mmetsp:Transcript_9891/g.28811  ORF Transcript_9891/g.28811 Transcript_9891/m.28811 type:complete len:223 (+) Transcript_9891:331-999(+)
MPDVAQVRREPGVHQQLHGAQGRVRVPDPLRRPLRERGRRRLQRVRGVAEEVRAAAPGRRRVPRAVAGGDREKIRHASLQRAVVHLGGPQRRVRYVRLPGPLLQRADAEDALRPAQLAHHGARWRVLYARHDTALCRGRKEAGDPLQPRQRVPPLSGRLVHSRLRGWQGKRRLGRLCARLLPRPERRVGRLRRRGALHADTELLGRREGAGDGGLRQGGSWV